MVNLSSFRQESGGVSGLGRSQILNPTPWPARPPYEVCAAPERRGDARARTPRLSEQPVTRWDEVRARYDEHSGALTVPARI